MVTPAGLPSTENKLYDRITHPMPSRSSIASVLANLRRFGTGGVRLAAGIRVKSPAHSSSHCRLHRHEAPPAAGAPIRPRSCPLHAVVPPGTLVARSSRHRSKILMVVRRWRMVMSTVCRHTASIPSNTAMSLAAHNLPRPGDKPAASPPSGLSCPAPFQRLRHDIAGILKVTSPDQSSSNLVVAYFPSLPQECSKSGLRYLPYRPSEVYRHDDDSG